MTPGPAAAWTGLRERFQSRGLRWTPQRRLILEVLDEADGHVTGSELVERCRSRDPLTTASTVYRTLRVLEELGLVRHAHGVDGREEFHVRPGSEHGHLYCEGCGGTWEIGADEAGRLIAEIHSTREFEVDLSHLAIVGRCARCRPPGAAAT